MSQIRAYGRYRTGGLWAGAGVSLTVVVVGSLVALFGMLEFDERCMHGLVQGPGGLRRVRYRAYPPATVCEFQGGEVSSVGSGTVLAVLLWAAMGVLVVCLLGALLAECFAPRPGGPLVVPTTPAADLRRTGATLLSMGSAFLLLYVPVGWPLLTGPSSACAAGGEWGAHPPATLEYGFFPPQATCRYTSGRTEHLNADWLANLAVLPAVPTLIAAAAFGLALRRRSEERRAPADGARR
ncbi:hypothetical protein [Streptomyces sp. C10-9-1]|uniref:hypothetical protein n=1 Tax=Streptomyces sp. C10-9-1 TaxID=1859285 RepID=UPI003D73A032